MADLDNTTTPFVWPGSGNITITDGASGSVVFTLVGSFTWTQTGRVVTEAMERRRHQSPPVVLETDDGNLSISINGLVTTFLGDSNVHPYEALTFSGNASAWTTKVTGTAKCYQIAWAINHPTGAVQTATFPYCHTDSIEINPDGDDGKFTLSASITCYANAPTIV